MLAALRTRSLTFWVFVLTILEVSTVEYAQLLGAFYFTLVVM
jgi:hypothetical protein